MKKPTLDSEYFCVIMFIIGFSYLADIALDKIKRPVLLQSGLESKNMTEMGFVNTDSILVVFFNISLEEEILMGAIQLFAYRLLAAASRIDWTVPVTILYGLVTKWA